MTPNDRLHSASSRSAELNAQQLQALSTLLSGPSCHVFPALDLCRLLALGPAAAQVAQLATGWATGTLRLTTHWVQFRIASKAPGLFQQQQVRQPPQNTTRLHSRSCTCETHTEGPLVSAAKDPSANSAHLTALRLLANCYQSAVLTTWLKAAREPLLDAFAGCAASSSKAVRQALAALLLNHAVAAQGGVGSDDWLPQVLSAVMELLGNAPVEDVETVHRCGMVPVVVWLRKQHSV